MVAPEKKGGQTKTIDKNPVNYANNMHTFQKRCQSRNQYKNNNKNNQHGKDNTDIP